jgi:hypothetical protein
MNGEKDGFIGDCVNAVLMVLPRMLLGLYAACAWGRHVLHKGPALCVLMQPPAPSWPCTLGIRSLETSLNLLHSLHSTGGNSWSKTKLSRVLNEIGTCGKQHMLSSKAEKQVERPYLAALVEDR